MQQKVCTVQELGDRGRATQAAPQILPASQKKRKTRGKQSSLHFYHLLLDMGWDAISNHCNYFQISYR